MSKYALVVEDESIVRQFVTHVLTILNYQVLEAESEEEAFELFRQHQQQIAYVYTDLQLAQGNGYSLYQRIRRHSPTTKVVVSSGIPGVDLSEIQADQKGNYLPKPFTVDSLIHSIEKQNMFAKPHGRMGTEQVRNVKNIGAA